MEVFLSRKLSHYCAVCGHAVEDDTFAYLLTTNPATDRLTILRWNRNLSRIERSRAACQPEHALELVAHWMASGTLELNFSQVVPSRVPRDPESTLTVQSTCPCAHPKPIGELTVNRESLQGVLENNPQALGSILDSLLEALQRDKNAEPGIIPAANTTEVLINVP